MAFFAIPLLYASSEVFMQADIIPHSCNISTLSKSKLFKETKKIETELAKEKKLMR